MNANQDGRTVPRDRKSYSTEDEVSTLSEQVDLLGLVKGNILKSKNVRGDGTLLYIECLNSLSQMHMDSCSSDLF